MMETEGKRMTSKKCEEKIMKGREKKANEREGNEKERRRRMSCPRFGRVSEEISEEAISAAENPLEA